MSPVTVRTMQTADATAVLAIYQAGMDAGNASFEHTAPTWAVFDAAKLPGHRLVAVGSDSPGDSSTVLGWVAISPVSARAVYAGVVEHSVYVDPPPSDSGSAGRCSTR
jgi:L-amino acid N-acyltransferase YncA